MHAKLLFCLIEGCWIILWKNILIGFLLVVMVIWGVYDFEAKKLDTQKTITPTSEQTNTASNKKSSVEKGDIAPDFTLQTIDGKNYRLSDFHGKKVLLNFFATWCPPCKGEMPHMEEFYKQNKDDGIVVLAVNLTTGESDPNNSLPKFISNYGLTFPVLLDRQGNIGDIYQAFSIPTSYFIDTKGVIQNKMVGGMDKETMNNLMSEVH
jgi:peroxiredoxin